MDTIYILWYQLNWLEFVTFAILPIAVVVLSLVYLLFNIRLLKFSFDFDIYFLTELEKSYTKKLDTLLVKIDDKYNLNWTIKEEA